MFISGSFTLDKYLSKKETEIKDDRKKEGEKGEDFEEDRDK